MKKLKKYHRNTKRITALALTAIILSSGGAASITSAMNMQPINQAAELQQVNTNLIELLRKEAPLNEIQQDIEAHRLLGDLEAYVNIPDELGQSPLMITISLWYKYGNDAAQMLLDAGANVESQTHDHTTVLMLICKRACNKNLNNRMNVEMLKKFFVNPAHVMISDDRGRTALNHAVGNYCSLESITALLNAMGYDLEAILAQLNTPDNFGTSVMDIATKHANDFNDPTIEEILQLLKKKPAQVKLCNHLRELQMEIPNIQTRLNTATDKASDLYKENKHLETLIFETEQLIDTSIEPVININPINLSKPKSKNKMGDEIADIQQKICDLLARPQKDLIVFQKNVDKLQKRYNELKIHTAKQESSADYQEGRNRALRQILATFKTEVSQYISIQKPIQ